jgi:S1-C subfamily serine protease
MPLQIRILSGALAGQVKHFDQAVIVVGRQGGLDLRFDPQQDLDVSGRHAEIRVSDTGFVLHDTRSTNGTFVNGKRVDGSIELKDGDRIQFGAKGPEAEVTYTAERPAHIPTPVRNTEQRIAAAVSRQTAGLKRVLIGAVVVLVVIGLGGAYYIRLQDAKQTEEFNKLIADNERMRITLQSSMRASGDTTLAREIERNIAALQQRLANARTAADSAPIKSDIQENEQQLRRMVAMDLPTIFKQNAPAVAILVSEVEIDGALKRFSGTGFSISKDGHIITNKHNVLVNGKSPRRIAVKFTDTREWYPATVVKVSDTDDDIALIKMVPEGPYPVVTGVSASGADAAEGMSLVSIGYPLGYETPQEGDGNDFMAKASLNPGTVSKKTTSVLQIDSYATHGSSGSPVFSNRGYVVGLVYGGAREAGGKIVYAVPAEKVAAFVPANLKGIVRD